MRIFDPHIHMTSRTTDDYEAMFEVGVRALVEPAFWLGQPRTTVGSFTDYFDALIGWERFRAAQCARRATALPCQGRCCGGRRGRLRLDDQG
jgi:predicted metal-dependent TIM-barrel fold hydrolase